MSGFDGNGQFSFTYNWVNDAANGIPITASRMDTQFSDATGGFDNCVTRDGQGAPSASIPFSAGLTSDTIGEVTPGAGVTAGGVLLKNGYIGTLQTTGATSIAAEPVGDTACYHLVRAQLTSGLAASTTTTVFRWLNPAGTLIGTNFVSGILTLNIVDDNNGANNTTIVESVTSTGNGATNASRVQLSGNVRGVAMISSVQVTADGVAGAILYSLTTTANGTTCTVRASFSGTVK